MSNEKTSELVPGSVRTQKLISRIEDGEIKIPEFQRGYVWKQNQIIELLDSINLNYPVGSVLLWEAEKEDRLKTSRNIAGINLPDTPESYPVKYCLDGQQRISSIFGVFCQSVVIEDNDSKYNPEKSIFEIYYDIQDKLFLPKAEIDENAPDRYFYLRNLFDSKKYNRWFMGKDVSDEVFDELSELQNRFQNYEIPVMEIKKRNKSEVGVIFERINSTGTKLSPLDLMSAWTWDESFHLRERIDDVLHDLERKSFGSIEEMLILQITSGIINETTATPEILNMDNKIIKSEWPKITEALKKSVDYLSGTLNCKTVRLLPFKQILCGLSYFFYQCKVPKPDQLTSIESWFWVTSFNEKYTGGRTTTKMNNDIEIIKQIVKGVLYKDIQGESLTFKSASLYDKKFSIQNPLTRAFLLLQAKQKPRDLATGQIIDVDKALSKYNKAEFHHVFPNAFLKRNRYTSNDINAIINFCFLSSSSNKLIKDDEPKDYMQLKVDQNQFSQIMSSNLLPEDLTAYTQNNYPLFQRKRAELVNTFLQSRI